MVQHYQLKLYPRQMSVKSWASNSSWCSSTIIRLSRHFVQIAYCWNTLQTTRILCIASNLLHAPNKHSHLAILWLIPSTPGTKDSTSRTKMFLVYCCQGTVLFLIYSRTLSSLWGACMTMEFTYFTLSRLGTLQYELHLWDVEVLSIQPRMPGYTHWWKSLLKL